MLRKTLENRMFAPSPQKRAARNPAATELEAYLNAPCENTDDIIKWWYTHRNMYPTLWKMATDYCSAPGELSL